MYSWADINYFTFPNISSSTAWLHQEINQLILQVNTYNSKQQGTIENKVARTFAG